jgi:cytochrome c peroxidase
VDAVYDMLAEAIGDFEKSPEVNRFSSKYDSYLAGFVQLTPQEMKGLKLFEGKAKCSLCHLSRPQLSPDGTTMIPPLFTDFTYDNLGIPKSMNPLIASNPIDYGLGGRADIMAMDPLGLQKGKHKVSTLRNIALTAPYGHNGYFATLREIVHFYNTAGIPGMWPSPEVNVNVNRAELGDLRLTSEQEADLVAFMLTLSDGFSPTAPAPFTLPPIP